MNAKTHKEPLLGEVKWMQVRERVKAADWHPSKAIIPAVTTPLKEVIWDGEEWQPYNDLPKQWTGGNWRDFLRPWFTLLEKARACQPITHEQMQSIPPSWRRQLFRHMIRPATERTSSSTESTT